MGSAVAEKKEIRPQDLVVCSKCNAKRPRRKFMPGQAGESPVQMCELCAEKMRKDKKLDAYVSKSPVFKETQARWKRWRADPDGFDPNE